MYKIIICILVVVFFTAQESRAQLVNCDPNSPECDRIEWVQYEKVANIVPFPNLAPCLVNLRFSLKKCDFGPSPCAIRIDGIEKVPNYMNCDNCDELRGIGHNTAGEIISNLIADIITTYLPILVDCLGFSSGTDTKTMAVYTPSCWRFIYDEGSSGPFGDPFDDTERMEPCDTTNCCTIYYNITRVENRQTRRYSITLNSTTYEGNPFLCDPYDPNPLDTSKPQIPSNGCEYICEP